MSNHMARTLCNKMVASIHIDKLEEFDGHKTVAYMFDKGVGLKAIIAIHRGNNTHPAFGATRYVKYEDETEALKDVLRLSRTMSFKSVLAGLPYGGAKGVILKNGRINGGRKEFFKAYAKCVDYLGGKFVTGCDVGVTNDDVKTMRKYSKHIVGVEADPVRFTALGVKYAIESCLKDLYGDASLAKRTFAFQGVGKTGGELLSLIYPEALEVIIADIDVDRLKEIKKAFPRVKIVDSDEIHKQDVDVFSPCAMYHTINSKTVRELKCKIVAGCANNQLESPIIGDILYKRDILYAPDYVINAGGLICVVDEYEYGNHRIKRAMARVEIIKDNMKKLIRESKLRNKPTNVVADEMARSLQANLK